jgi:hypothetical protein
MYQIPTDIKVGMLNIEKNSIKNLWQCSFSLMLQDTKSRYVSLPCFSATFLSNFFLFPATKRSGGSCRAHCTGTGISEASSLSTSTCRNPSIAGYSVAK